MKTSGQIILYVSLNLPWTALQGPSFETWENKGTIASHRPSHPLISSTLLPFAFVHQKYTDAFKEDASQGNREVGEDRELSKLKPNSFFSPAKPETTLLRFPSSLVFCFLLSQMPQVSLRALLCLFVCVALGCRLVYKLGRGQTWSGPDVSSPGEAQCCRNALHTARTSEMSLVFLLLRDPVEQSLIVSILDWLHPFW